MKLSIRNLFLIILFCGIFIISLKPIIDPDFWWHLRTGQLIDQTHSIPTADPFSFTANGKQWVAHEWLSELFIYKIYTIGGFGLLMIIFSVIISTTCAFVYLRCPSGSKPYIAGVILLLGALSSVPIWGVRPQMFTLLFMSIFLFLLDRYRRDGDFRTLIPLPIIMVLWVNLHAGFIIGIALESIFIIGHLLENLSLMGAKKETTQALSQRSLWYLFSVLIISLMATALNPSGFRILVYPFQTLTDPAMQGLINEWFSPDFHQGIWQPFVIMLLLLIGAGLGSKRTISITKILLTLVFAYGALRSIRNIPLFVIVVIPVLTEQLESVISLRNETRNQGRHFGSIALVLLFAIALIMSLGYIRVANDQQKNEAKFFPRAALDWIIANKPEGNMFNSYNWGGYLIWRLYPQYLVYIDGRADLYGEKFINNYMKIHTAKPGWEAELKQRDIQNVLVESDSRLADALRQNASWQNLFEDQVSVLFSRK